MKARKVQEAAGVGGVSAERTIDLRKPRHKQPSRIRRLERQEVEIGDGGAGDVGKIESARSVRGQRKIAKVRFDQLSDTAQRKLRAVLSCDVSASNVGEC